MSESVKERVTYRDVKNLKISGFNMINYLRKEILVFFLLRSKLNIRFTIFSAGEVEKGVRVIRDDRARILDA